MNVVASTWISTSTVRPVAPSISKLPKLAVVEGRTRVTCTGGTQQWEVHAATQGEETFEARPAIADAVRWVAPTAATLPTRGSGGLRSIWWGKALRTVLLARGRGVDSPVQATG